MNRNCVFVRRLCWLRSSGSEALCGELVQECYISMWNHFPSLRPGVGMLRERAWVFWQCRSAFSHFQRQKQEDWVLLDIQSVDTLVADTDSEQRELIEELAAGLTPGERSILNQMLQGYTDKEIAEKTGQQTENIKKQRQRLIQKMKNTYETINTNER